MRTNAPEGRGDEHPPPLPYQAPRDAGRPGMARRCGDSGGSDDGSGGRSCARDRLLGPWHGLAELSDLVRAVRNERHQAPCHGNHDPGGLPGAEPDRRERGGRPGTACRRGRGTRQGPGSPAHRPRQPVPVRTGPDSLRSPPAPGPGDSRGGRSAQQGRVRLGDPGRLAGHGRAGRVGNGPLGQPPGTGTRWRPDARAELRPLRAGHRRLADVDRLPGQQRDRPGLGGLRAAAAGGRPGHDPGVPWPGA